MTMSATVPDIVATSEATSDSSQPTHSSQPTQRRLLRESVWVVGGRLLGIGTAIGINVVLARVLPPADVGIFLLLGSILTFSSFVAMFGLNAGLVRFVSESIGVGDADQARRVLRQGTKVAILSVSCGGLICGGFLLLAGEWLFDLPQVVVLAPLVACGVVGAATIQLCASLLRSFHDSRVSIMLTGQFGGPICNLLFGGLTIGLYFLTTPTLNQVMACSAFSMCAVLPLAIYSCYRISERQLATLHSAASTSAKKLQRVNATETAAPNSFAMMGLLVVCLPLMLTQSLSYITGQADIWIAGANVAHEEVALYGAARRLMLLIGMPMQLVNLTVIASIAELRARGQLQELQRILRSAATLAAIPALLVWLPIVIFPGQLATLIFGPYYADCAATLRILSIGQLVFVSVGAAELTLMMSGHHLKALSVNIFTSIALFISGITLSQQWGIQGLAIAWSAIVSIQCLSFWLFARRSVGVWTGLDFRFLREARKMLAKLQSKWLNPSREGTS